MFLLQTIFLSVRKTRRSSDLGVGGTALDRPSQAAPGSPTGPGMTQAPTGDPEERAGRPLQEPPREVVGDKADLAAETPWGQELWNVHLCGHLAHSYRGLLKWAEHRRAGPQVTLNPAGQGRVTGRTGPHPWSAGCRRHTGQDDRARREVRAPRPQRTGQPRPPSRGHPCPRCRFQDKPPGAPPASRSGLRLPRVRLFTSPELGVVASPDRWPAAAAVTQSPLGNVAALLNAQALPGSHCREERGGPHRTLTVHAAWVPGRWQVAGGCWPQPDTLQLQASSGQPKETPAPRTVTGEKPGPHHRLQEQVLTVPTGTLQPLSCRVGWGSLEHPLLLLALSLQDLVSPETPKPKQTAPASPSSNAATAPPGSQGGFLTSAVKNPPPRSCEVVSRYKEESQALWPSLL